MHSQHLSRRGSAEDIMTRSRGVASERFCTIIASNYMPQARVLAASLAEHHPDLLPLLVLCVDEPAEGAESEANLEIVRPDELTIPKRTFWRMATLYDTTELCTALKPWLLEHLLAQGIEVAVYLDPDMLLLQPLSGMLDDARGAVALLTPHRLTPLGDDNLQPSEQSLLLSGFFNLGFIAVTPRALPFLDWWKERLEFKSLIDHGSGYFTDQRWIDQAVHLFGLSMTRDPRLNVAYWNFDERLDNVRLMGTEDQSRPSLLHFSGYSPAVPWLVSRHVADKPRVELTAEPAILTAFDHYSDLLVAAGWIEGDLETLWPVLADGSRRGIEFRAAYRSAIRLSTIRSKALPPPALANYFSEYVDWAASPEAGEELPRWVDAVWHCRADLQDFAPDPLFADCRRLVDWAETQGVAESWVPTTVGRRIGSSHHKQPSRSDSFRATVPMHSGVTGGVRLEGYLDAVLGVGEAGRAVARGLHEAGINFEERIWRASNSPRRDVGPVSASSDQRATVEIVVVNADQLERWNSSRPSSPSPDWRIGVWSWELPYFPTEMASAERHVDEIWTTSEYSAAALRGAVTKPVYVVPLNLRNEVTGTVHACATSKSTEPKDVIGEPYFAFVFDYHSDFARKNPLGLIHAYQRVFFSGEGGPRLAIKTLNSASCPEDAQRVRYEAARCRAVVIEDVWCQARVLRFIGDAVAYTSLHRAEGFGFTLLEAMALGVPALATGYSGNLEFMDAGNSYLVPYEEVPVTGSKVYRVPSVWAQPDEGAAAEAMASIVQNPADARARAERAQRDVAERFNPEVTARFISERLGSIGSLDSVLRQSTLPAGAASKAGSSASREDPSQCRRIVSTVRRWR
jgi:hypothetical protein